MKKIIKMSLVAATAVSCFTSNVSAKSIADIADSVDVFGYVQIRYDENTQSSDNASSYTHKEVLGVTGKINDDLSYMFAGANLKADKSDDGADYSGFLMVYNYFTYTGIENTSISIGRQGIDTPLTVVYDPADATSEATGVTLTSKLGPVTLNAAHFQSTDFDTVAGRYNNPGETIDGGESYTHIGLSGKAGPVSLDAWYANMSDRYDTYTVGASAKIKTEEVMVSPYARYTSADVEGINEDQSLSKIGVNIKAGIIGAGIGYGKTDKKGGWVTFDKDAAANIQGWNVSLLGNADADLVKANINVDALPNLNIGLNYTTLDVASVDKSEVFAQIKYQMSSNFSAMVKIGQIEEDDTNDKEIGRVDLLWLF
ncbi:porin [Arcobacteraceae bacterium]|nr:porin [Arcobacteraceae bacterium]